MDQDGNPLDSSRSQVSSTSKNSLLPKLKPNPTAQIISIEAKTQIINEPTKIDFELTTVTPIPAKGSIIKIKVPFAFFSPDIQIQSGSELPCNFKRCEYQQYNSSHFIIRVEGDLECQDLICGPGEMHTVRISSGLRNRYSVQAPESIDYQYFGIETYLSQGLLIDTSEELPYTPEVWDLSLPAMNRVAFDSYALSTSDKAGQEGNLDVTIKMRLIGARTFVRRDNDIKLTFEGEQGAQYRLVSGPRECFINEIKSPVCQMITHANSPEGYIKAILLSVPVDRIDSPNDLNVRITGLGNPLSLKPVAKGSSITALIYSRDPVNAIAQGSYVLSKTLNLVKEPSSMDQESIKILRSGKLGENLFNK